jgi:hypothetical protein
LRLFTGISLLGNNIARTYCILVPGQDERDTTKRVLLVNCLFQRQVQNRQEEERLTQQHAPALVLDLVARGNVMKGWNWFA